MTLAVAKKSKRRVVLVADTMISEHGNPLPIENGIVKTVVINNDLTLAYSGSPELARKIIQTLSDFRKIPNYREIKKQILPICIACNVDIIIAIDARAPKLFAIKDNQIHAKESAWIGDYDAFRAYQGYRTGAISASRFQANFIARTAQGSKDRVATLLDLIGSLKTVVADPAIVSVGGFVTAVMNDDGRFQHIPYSEIFYSRICETIAPGLANTLSIDEEDRKYQHSVVVARNSDKPAIGFYFLEPQKLLIFSRDSSGLMAKAETLSNINSESLIDPTQVCEYSFDYVLISHGPDVDY